MSLHSEYAYSNPNWGAPLLTKLVFCYRGCGTILKVKHQRGERVTAWQQCNTCGVKADNGGFNESGATS